MESTLVTAVRTANVIGRDFQRVVNGVVQAMSSELAAAAERTARERRAAEMRRQLDRLIDEWQRQQPQPPLLTEAPLRAEIVALTKAPVVGLIGSGYFAM